MGSIFRTSLMVLIIGCVRAQTDVITHKESSDYYYDSPNYHDGNCGHMTSFGTASSNPFTPGTTSRISVRFNLNASNKEVEIIDRLNINQSYSKHLSLDYSWDGSKHWRYGINLVNLTNSVKGEYSVWLGFSSPSRFRPKLLGPQDVMPTYRRRALFNIVEVNFTHQNPSYIRAIQTQQVESLDVNSTCQCLNDGDTHFAVDFRLSDNTQCPCGCTHGLLNISTNATLQPPKVDWCVGVGVAWFSISGLLIEWPKISGVRLIYNNKGRYFAVSKDTMSNRIEVEGSTVRLQYNVSGCDDTCMKFQTLDERIIKTVNYPKTKVVKKTDTTSTIEFSAINNSFIGQIIVEYADNQSMIARTTVTSTSESITIPVTSGIFRIVYGNSMGNYSDPKCDFFNHHTLIDLDPSETSPVSGLELLHGLAGCALCLDGLLLIVFVVVLVLSCKKRGDAEKKSAGKQIKIACIVCGAVLLICLGLSIAASSFSAESENRTAWLTGIWCVFVIDSLLFLGLIIKQRGGSLSEKPEEALGPQVQESYRMTKGKYHDERSRDASIKDKDDFPDIKNRTRHSQLPPLQEVGKRHIKRDLPDLSDRTRYRQLPPLNGPN